MDSQKSVMNTAIRCLALALLVFLLLAGCTPTDGTLDRAWQDNFDLPVSGSPTMTIFGSPPLDASPTPEPPQASTATQAAPDRAWQINLYPGPDHYAGDVLTLEVPLHYRIDGLRTLETTVTIDGGDPIMVKAQVVANLIHNTTEIILPDLWETRGQAGRHTLRVQARLPRGVVLDAATTVEIRPEHERPAQEENARWLTRETGCCRLNFVSGTAAERDIDRLADFVDQSVAEVSAAFKLAPDRFKLSFFFIDTVWGNGGYANKEGIVIYYVDRDFGPGIGDEILTTFRHEVTHHAQWMLQTAESASALNEGLAVYVGAGHYFTQPIRERTAALYRLGHFLPILEINRPNLTQIHEAGYLQSAGLVAYLVDRYGWDALLQFYSTILPEKIDNHKWETWLAGALHENFGITIAQLEADFITWLKNTDPGDQIENLRMTLRLQEARREYQYRYAPFLEYYALGNLGDIEQLSLLTREASSPEAVAIEALIQSAQLAVYRGEYVTAATMLSAIEDFLDTGALGHPLAADYLSVAQTLDEWGFEAQEISFSDGEVHAVVTAEKADLLTLTLVPVGSDWLLAAD